VSGDFDRKAAASLPGLLGVEFTEIRAGFIRGRMDIKPHHLAPNGYLHAASVIALADSACGRGCIASLPDGASSFTTIELKANFLGTALDGGVVAQARLAHGGRTTQVWDATIAREKDDKQIALFRCTQLILYPK
jgi:1,4-dihydroxy-2-naphthoyl-CoA hydrolase